MTGTPGVSKPPVARRMLPPELIILCACMISMLTFGPRASSGNFQLPVMTANSWGSDTFSFALAMQNLLWGIGQPFAGALADRFGTRLVLSGGAILYAAGLALMSVSSTPATFTFSAGLLIGFGLSGCSMSLVVGALAKLVPDNKRAMAFGLVTAAGSFGQFLFSPLSGFMIETLGWQMTTVLFGALMLCVLPLSLAVASAPPAPATAGAPRPQSTREALSEAFGHRSYMLLVLGFFTCGFQLAFITVHFQKYVVEAGLPASVGYWAFALVGLFNIVGSLGSGYLSNRMPRRYILSIIYFSRAVTTVVFIMAPPTMVGAYLFGAISGLLWLSTVPPTSAIIGHMFGTRYFAMLYGFAFFSHQVGGFLGVLLGGVLREATGSYTIVWWLSIALGVASALINLPIVEKPIVRKESVATA
ncbi:MAG: MFS transporter [Beijerinckiaceae bacterium]|nr:MFS transporter [Beijerinckiaceae bacterium]